MAFVGLLSKFALTADCACLALLRSRCSSANVAAACFAVIWDPPKRVSLNFGVGIGCWSGRWSLMNESSDSAVTRAYISVRVRC